MKSYITVILLTLASALPSTLWSQTQVIPAQAQSAPMLLKGAILHLGNGEAIESGAIAFEAGKITLVQSMADPLDESGYTVVDVAGQHIYPGFILPQTNMGVEEVSSVNAMNDAAEEGVYNPNVRTLVAYNTDSEFIPTMRFNGILLAQVVPEGEVIPGSASVVQLDAWNWEDAAYAADHAIMMNWPTKYYSPRWWLGETEKRKNPNYEQILEELDQLFADALSYGQLANPVSTNLKLAAMQGLFDGSKALHLVTNDAKSIVKGVNLAKKHGVKRIVVVGGYYALLVKDFLVENDIPVILGNIHSKPREDHEDTVHPFKMAQAFHEAGIDYCLMWQGMTSRARNLPFMAGTTVAYGVPYEAAVQSISGKAAEILGIADRTGTLTVGKDATLFVSQGDALDMRTNQLSHAFIQGRKIQLEARQEFLYQKYSDKYGHQIED